MRRLEVELRRETLDRHAKIDRIRITCPTPPHPKGGRIEFSFGRRGWPLLSVIVWTEFARDLAQACNALIWRRIEGREDPQPEDTP